MRTQILLISLKMIIQSKSYFFCFIRIVRRRNKIEMFIITLAANSWILSRICRIKYLKYGHDDVIELRAASPNIKLKFIVFFIQLQKRSHTRNECEHICLTSCEWNLFTFVHEFANRMCSHFFLLIFKIHIRRKYRNFLFFFLHIC